jgi:hypothetical protein
MVQQQLVAVAGDQVLMELVIMLLKAVLVAVLMAFTLLLTVQALMQTVLMPQPILEVVEVVLLGQSLGARPWAVQAALVL